MTICSSTSANAESTGYNSMLTIGWYEPAFAGDLWVLDEDGVLHYEGQKFVCKDGVFFTLDEQDDPGDEKMLKLWSVSIWDAANQKLVCYDEPMTGRLESSVKVSAAFKFELDPLRLDDYQFLIAERGRLRELDED